MTLDLEQALLWAKGFGLQWVELRFVWGKYVTDFTPDDVKRAQDLLAKHQVKVSVIDSAYYKTPLPGTQGPPTVIPCSITIPQYPSASPRWLFATPIQCSADDTRRVSVRFRWLGTDGGGPVTRDVPGACRYLVIAQKAAKAIKPPLPLSVRKVCS